MIKKLLVIILIPFFLFLSNQQYQGKKYWIFLKDKGLPQTDISENIATIKNNLSERVLKRRSKVLQFHNLVDESDLPIYQPYIDELNNLHIEPIVKSKWLNAISAKLSTEQIELVKNLPFVKKIQPVTFYVRRDLSEEQPQHFLKSFSQSNQNTLDYGPSFTQNSMMQIPDVHQMGINGYGVLVGMLDTGFRYKYHEAFSRLQVVAEYDFINRDKVTENEANDNKSQHNHGTQVLSTIASYKEGQLIGPAYCANYILAKTENIRSETIIEEDYWVAGIEWMEEYGVDVVNSSLGYNDWYSYADMDGNTAITTIAADLAVKKGVVVVNSMGNEGNTPGSIIAPADGDSVISVGAIYSDGRLTSFSSIGPTWDGRIKPDVIALGTGVYTILPSSIDTYTYSSGTSFSSPLVAGVAALILSAHSYLTPLQVRQALRETTNNANNPNNEYGWGLVNAYKSLFYYGLFFSNLPHVSNDSLGHKITIKILSKNPINKDSVFVYYSVFKNPFIKMNLFPTLNQDEYQTWIPFQTPNVKIKFYFSAKDESGDFKYHPYYAPEEYFTFYAFDTTVNPAKEPVFPSNFVLYQNYPNPFNSNTSIKYEILSPGQVNLTIYNISGQLVKTLTNDFFQVGTYQKIWNGTNNEGEMVTSGVYFYKLKIDNSLEIKKMMILH